MIEVHSDLLFQHLNEINTYIYIEIVTECDRYL